MRKLVFALLVVALIIGVSWIAANLGNHNSVQIQTAKSLPRQFAEKSPHPKAVVEESLTNSEAVSSSKSRLSNSGSPLAVELNAPDSTGTRDVEVLHELLRQYLRRLHSRQGLPIGNDTDLLRALTGHNPMKLVILPPNHPAVGADGRLRDRWGKPYLIHPRGDGAYEIRSAGPDRTMFTADDLVANPAR